ncbi:MAG: hypothetical protein WAP03_29805 [Methylorubrum rhodinum]|uniref:hypothetical protein n=1 Tax=Methylorubrum rhodinum TaxID=29428 RepID=UPI003BB11DF8
MTLDRHIARLLAVVIVMIAASFGVSVAQAHQGHAHRHASTAAAAPVATAPVQAAKPVAAPVAVNTASKLVGAFALLAQTAPRTTRTAFAVSAFNADDCDDCGGCNGLCCGMGMVCCHSALTSACVTAALPPMLAILVPVLQQTARPSLTPEALPKPPRSFA